MNKKKISKTEFIDRFDRLCGKGDLIQFPKSNTDRLILLGSIIIQLEPQKEYSEKSINEAIVKWIDKMANQSYLDHVTLRRYLVDLRLLERNRAGDCYRVSKSRMSGLFEDVILTIDPFLLIKNFREEREARKKEWKNNLK
ncbi:MAG: DUF2087 domain-containing protein [candidate division WOR-3 bacterium]|jgi:hypothetical protein